MIDALGFTAIDAMAPGILMSISVLSLPLYASGPDDNGAARVVVDDLYRIPINNSSLVRSIAVPSEDRFSIKADHAQDRLSVLG
jgi:hypothetical protein